ncbi:MAG: hypothetical protein D3910_21930 [Candidatus Electrothrix sp. ATG2]|nr:hypothetical protein [Candidatus Electrothrix sp. ATG2]
MALNQKKLQKKKAKKAAKSKARKATQKQKSLMAVVNHKLAKQKAFNAPIYECWESEQIFDTSKMVGMGSVIMTRKTSDNNILMSVFLVDIYCLGIKNSMVKFFSEEKYRDFLAQMPEGKIKKIHPACARKLVEESEQYAAGLGFSPHNDYREAQKIFGDIDSATCPRSFEFGKDGKPYYLAGPFDKPRFRRNVLNTLEKKCGPDGYHYTLPVGEDGDLF